MHKFTFVSALLLIVSSVFASESPDVVVDNPAPGSLSPKEVKSETLAPASPVAAIPGSPVAAIPGSPVTSIPGVTVPGVKTGANQRGSTCNMPSTRNRRRTPGSDEY